MSVERAGTPLDGPMAQRQRLAVLAFIGGSGGGVSRDRLLATLWPETESARARHALSNALYSIRGALGEGAVVSSSDELRLDPALVEVDALQFETAVRAQELERAVELYEGPFLDGFSMNSVEFERWAESVRDRLEARYASALEQLATNAQARGDVRDSAQLWRRFAAQDPYSAHGALALMRALELAGDPAGALVHARVHALLMADDLDAGPDSAVEALAAEIGERMASAEPVGPQDEEAPASPAESGAAPVEARDEDPTEAHIGAPTEVPTASPLETLAPRGARPRSRLAMVLVGAVLGIALLVVFSMTGTDSSATADVSTIRKLAVLPLHNLSPNPDQAYFADAMTEVLTSELSRLDSLTVVSRTSASRFSDSSLSMAEIAEILGVDGVIEGSVFRAGDNVRVTVQLIHGATDEQVWSGSYEASTEDPIALQRQVALAVTDALSLSLSSRERDRLDAAPEVSQEAQEAFFRGLYQYRRFTPEAVRGAIDDFHQAVDLDSAFADAASMLAGSYFVLTQAMASMPAGEGMPLAREWAERAILLDPRSPDARSALGWVSLFYDRDLRAAEQHFAASISVRPDAPAPYNGLAFVQLIDGRPEEAIASGRAAMSLVRLDLSYRASLAELYYFSRRFDEALAELDGVLDTDARFGRAHLIRRWVFEARSQWGEAIEAHRSWLELSRDISADEQELALRTEVPATQTGYWRWRLGGLERGKASSSPTPIFVAEVYAELGEPEMAFQYLAEAIAARDGQVMFLGVQPSWDTLRDDPRFGALLSQLGLTEYGVR